jgi:acetylornithine deacetylase/succinyl-diaminopimelate desuccinylase-like protein
MPGDPAAAVPTAANLPQLLARLVKSGTVQPALDTFARERAWINEQHLKLCRIAAPTFFEQKRAEWMVEQFRKLNWEARLDKAGNVIAMLKSRRESPLLAITAHLDTVLAPRTEEEIKLAPDGRFLGPGVSDNGAGLAALLAFAAAFQRSDLLDRAPGGVLLVANVGEEGEGNLSGMRYLCKQSSLASRINAFLVLDGPSTDHITCQALASKRFEITLTGPGGHSWSDYGVANPAHALSRMITLFADQRALDNGGPRSSFNFGILEGGSSINSIPDLARAKVDLRSASVARIEAMSAQLLECLESAVDRENQQSTGARLNAKIKEIGSRPGGQLASDSPLLGCMRAIDAHLSIRSQIDCASTDANIPLSMGIPALSIGAGGRGGGAHTPGEWFHPEGRDLGLRRAFLLAALILLHPEILEA